MVSLDISFHRIATEVLQMLTILSQNTISFVRLTVNSCLCVCNCNIPQNPRRVWVGRVLKDHPIPTPCHGQGYIYLQISITPSICPPAPLWCHRVCERGEPQVRTGSRGSRGTMRNDPEMDGPAAPLSHLLKQRPFLLPWQQHPGMGYLLWFLTVCNWNWCLLIPFSGSWWV